MPIGMTTIRSNSGLQGKDAHRGVCRHGGGTLRHSMPLFQVEPTKPPNQCVFMFLVMSSIRRHLHSSSSIQGSTETSTAAVICTCQPEAIGSVHPNIRIYLEGHSPEEFRQLDPETRRKILHTSLFDPEPIEVGIESSSPDTPDVYLRQEKFVDSSADILQVIIESREVYYGDNHFAMPLQYLDTFMSEELQRPDSELSVPIVALVRRITVALGLHGGSGWKGQAHQLRKLLEFENAEGIILILQGGGISDGSDLSTHQTLYEIAAVVKDIKEKFGDKFGIFKSVLRQEEDKSPRMESIKFYWDEPTEAARRRVYNGAAPFHEVVQVEIEEWSRGTPSAGPWETLM